MRSKMWDEIADPFSNINRANVHLLCKDHHYEEKTFSWPSWLSNGNSMPLNICGGIVKVGEICQYFAAIWPLHLVKSVIYYCYSRGWYGLKDTFFSLKNGEMRLFCKQCRPYLDLVLINVSGTEVWYPGRTWWHDGYLRPGPLRHQEPSTSIVQTMLESTNWLSFNPANPLLRNGSTLKPGMVFFILDVWQYFCQMLCTHWYCIFLQFYVGSHIILESCRYIRIRWGFLGISRMW